MLLELCLRLNQNKAKPYLAFDLKQVVYLVSPDPEVPLPALRVAHEELVEQVVEVAQSAVPPQVVLRLAQERVPLPVRPDEGHLFVYLMTN